MKIELKKLDIFICMRSNNIYLKFITSCYHKLKFITSCYHKLKFITSIKSK
jgi:hypothetical protein